MPVNSHEQLPLVEVAGSPRKRGQAQGEAARSQIQQSLESYREAAHFHTQLNWKQALERTQEMLPLSEARFPEFLQELRGIAEGARASFAEVWAVNCYEELLDQTDLQRGCTCIGVTRLGQERGTYLAHNEDWLIQDLGTVYLVKAALGDGRAYLALTYGPLLANVGLNDSGIGVVINSVHSSEVQPGVPRVVYARAVLEARSLSDAISACNFERRAGGYSFLLGSAKGELVCVETSAIRARVHQVAASTFVHTNHFLDPGLQKSEVMPPGSSSLHRFERARDLVEAMPPPIQPEDFQDLLRDHDGFPGSICLHERVEDPAHQREGTIASLIVDLEARLIWAAAGPPCQNDYFPYALD